MEYIRRSSFIIMVSVIMVSCADNHYSIKSRLEKQEIEILRLEKDLFSADPVGIDIMRDSLMAKYGDFIQLFAYIIDAGSLRDSSAFEKILEFSSKRRNYEVYMTVMEKFPDMEKYSNQFGTAWSRYNYYFPDSVIPGIYTFISDFNNSIIVGDSVLGIGLDRYLGAGNRYYSEMGIYSYLIEKMVPSRIVHDAIYAWAKASYPYTETDASDDLLSYMIYEGKLLYFTKCMLYDHPDSLLFGFNSGQMTFCRNNELGMWEYLIEHDMLFSTDKMLIRKLTGEAPFTTYFSSESPGRASLWLGFRIVESYMKRNPETGLQQLMLEKDERKILEYAKYDPQNKRSR